ncbi:MFS transporter [Serinibacter arcticus]|uniref:Major facilitator superfamily MFS_1 n=1 Tax=Serinibacter arcticus TaxID=1655435 RepID=A0A4Z1E1A0_9MICO|nr:MFS transporter [Serinibacter arcticus]TGO04462.1 major facilitator superfamily MFS_1 [Serinibacter arcticus]
MVSTTPLVVAATGLIAVTYGVVRYGYGLQLPQLTAEFGLSSTTAGLIASGSFAAYCLAALVARRIVRRSPRAVLWLAAGLAAGGAGVVAVAGSPWVMASGVLVAGGAAGAASPALVAAVAAGVPVARAARAQSVVNAGTGLGVVAVGAAVLAAPHLWRPVWVAAAVAALVAAAVVDRRTPWPARSRPGADLRTDRDGAAPLRGAVTAALLAGAGSAAVWTFGRDLVTTAGGLSERTTAALWVLLGAAAVLGAASGDVVRVLGLPWAWTLTAALSGAATAALVLVPDRTVVAALSAAVFGGAYTALSGVLISWAAQLRPDGAGAATAVLFTALTAGQAAGAAVAGAALERADVVVVFGGSAVALLLAALLRPTTRGPAVGQAVATERRVRRRAIPRA